ncbi:MAG TPA: DUF6585 family protein [Gemmataceae bacterium]|nr:DUF6585 family protein [Gemmataceae bacterium]
MTTAFEIESVLGLPPEVGTLGQPLQVHREAPAYIKAILLFFAGFLFLGVASLCAFVYCNVPANQKDVLPARTILSIAGGLGLLGSGTCLGGWSKSGLGRRAPRWAYVIYRQALVVVEKQSTSIIRWNEITALVSPRPLGDFHITTRDGRTFPIRRMVRDYQGLISFIYQRAIDQIIAPAKRALDSGQSVTFGPLELSRQAIRYKGKTLPWDQIAALYIQVGRGGRRLRIRAAGSLFPWCSVDIESFSNGVLLPDLLRHVCPARFVR